MLSFFLLQFALASDCSHPFPLKTKQGLREACLLYDKSYQIGHINFYSFPKVRLAGDTWPYKDRDFLYNKETREKLCEILGTKGEAPRSHISDLATRGVKYSSNGFTTVPALRSIKVLACRLIDTTL